MALFSFYSDSGVRHIQAPDPEIHLLGFDYCNQTLRDDVFQDDRNSRIKSLKSGDGRGEDRRGNGRE